MVNSNLKDNEKFYFTEFYSLYQRVLNLEAYARAFPGLTSAEASQIDVTLFSFSIEIIDRI